MSNLERSLFLGFKKQEAVFLYLFISEWGWREHGGKTAHVAQLVEHILGKDEVMGSIPIKSFTWVTRNRNKAIPPRSRPGFPSREMQFTITTKKKPNDNG